MKNKTLSKAEVRVASLVTKGLNNLEIAEKLCVCEKTVKFHLTNVYKKLGVKSRTQLVRNRLQGKATSEELTIMRDIIFNG